MLQSLEYVHLSGREMAHHGTYLACTKQILAAACSSYESFPGWGHILLCVLSNVSYKGGDWNDLELARVLL